MNTDQSKINNEFASWVRNLFWKGHLNHESLFKEAYDKAMELKDKVNWNHGFSDSSDDKDWLYNFLKDSGMIPNKYKLDMIMNCLEIMPQENRDKVIPYVVILIAHWSVGKKNWLACRKYIKTIRNTYASEVTLESMWLTIMEYIIRWKYQTDTPTFIKCILGFT